MRNDLVVVFDLDDTLYPEINYQLSGIAAVELWITKIFNLEYKDRILSFYREGICDIWQSVCDDLGFSSEFKDSLKWIYRLHTPSIELSKDIKDLLNFLKKNYVQICILSDGRSISQRKKIEKLGLTDFPIFISEEYNSEKPELNRFFKIQEIWPQRKYIYIGDNPEKDFVCSKELEWFSIGADWFPDKIHKISSSPKYPPNKWVKHPFEIIQIIKELKF